MYQEDLSVATFLNYQLITMGHLQVPQPNSATIWSTDCCRQNVNNCYRIKNILICGYIYVIIGKYTQLWVEMKYQRLHIRVPASGDAILKRKGDVMVEASIINVSEGGICITALSHLINQHEYQVQVITPSHGKIHFSGVPIYQTFESIGIKITSIEKEQLKIIYQIIGSFQLTNDFIKFIDERDLIQDWLVDESGEDIAIIFETEEENDK